MNKIPDYLLNGWVDDKDKVEAIKSELDFPFLFQAGPEIKGTGKRKIALLHKSFDVINQRFPLRHQRTGDCVSMATALAVDVLNSSEIVFGDRQKFEHTVATEPIYYGSRVVIGKNRIRGAGSIGAWAVKYISQYGVLFRKKYDFDDLSVYDSSKADDWGYNKSVPKEVNEESKKNKILNYTACECYDDVRDSIYNGYPVIVCSNRGFDRKRDNEGFAKPLGTWHHAMAFLAVDDYYKRKGVLCANSWGSDWITGPKRHGQPDGTFWVDAKIVDYMCSRGDTWAISGFNGFKLKNNMRAV